MSIDCFQKQNKTLSKCVLFDSVFYEIILQRFNSKINKNQLYWICRISKNLWLIVFDLQKIHYSKSTLFELSNNGM